MRKILLIGILLLAAGCGGGNKAKEDATPAPGKAVLVFPAQNSACTSGTVVSDDVSTIDFSWNATDNTDTYDVVIKDLLTNKITTQTANTNQLQVNLSRNTPYAWYVQSKSSGTIKTTQSDTWKFYNAGLGVVSYAPFPAEITSPTYGQVVTASSGTVNLTWKGSSIDNNIVAYGVYFGTDPSPAALQDNIKDSFLNNISVKSNTTYYWRVVTMDANGNFSDSGTYQFKVN